MSPKELLDDILTDLEMVSKHDPDRDGCMIPTYKGDWIRSSDIDEIIEKIKNFRIERSGGTDDCSKN